MQSKVSSENNPWQSLHLSLQDMLAGYIDNELTRQEREIIEAHLSGCHDCREDLLRQQTLSLALNDLPLKRLSKTYHQQLKQTILAAETTKIKLVRSKVTIFFDKLGPLFSKQNSLTIGGWVVACVFLVMFKFPLSYQLTLGNSEIPMLTDALTVYKQTQHQALPKIGLVQKDIAPITWREGKLLVSWSTKIGGEPAKVYAMRHHNEVVLQYKIDQTVFLRNPIVRQAIATQGFFKTELDNLAVLVLPSQNAGIIIISSRNLLPETEIIRRSSV